jgi:tRNA G18 (ribose-2'-O)-methylase SpoU
MADFTKKKFLSLPIERQHRQCAALLRRLYDALTTGQEMEEEKMLYKEFNAWMSQEELLLISFQTLSNRYHWHLQKANTYLKEHNLLPSARKGDRQIAIEGSWLIDIYLDQIRSAHNVGSILRTVEAFNLGQVYFSEFTPFKTHKQVEKAAMGSQQWVNCYQQNSFSNLTPPFIALETSPDALPLYEFIFPNQFTLIVGNEEYGCSEEVLKEANYLLEIPLRGHKNSLNVANAFAIVVGEIYRQKQLIGTHNDKEIKQSENP